MVTIKEIAALTGVSPTTVANVIHGRRGKMSDETWNKVKAALEDCRYSSNMGKIIGNSGSGLIAVVINYERRETENVFMNPFYGEIVEAIERKLRQNGYYMMLYVSGEYNETLRMLSHCNAEGAVLLGVPPEDVPKIKEYLKLPAVFIDSYWQDQDKDFDNVGLQDFEGGYEMTKYLIRQGHSRIAFMADGENLVGVDYERYAGYCKALKEIGSFNGNEDYYCLPFEKNIRHEMLRQFCRKKLKQYTALFFASDYYAMDAVNIFSTQAIKVPDDISVVGFDDNIFAQQCRPRLTTMRQNTPEKGRVAVKNLLKLIRGEDLLHNVRLPAELIVRDSVRRKKE